MDVTVPTVALVSPVDVATVNMMLAVRYIFVD